MGNSHPALTHLVSDVAPVNNAVRDGTELRGTGESEDEVQPKMSFNRKRMRAYSGDVAKALVNTMPARTAKQGSRSWRVTASTMRTLSAELLLDVRGMAQAASLLKDEC